MNKKLFTLLTSAAMMATMAPSVFAETMDFRIKKASEADGKITYDISVRADKGITGLQWYFKSNGGLGTNDTYDEDDETTAGFHYDADGVKAMFKKGDLTYTPELHKMPGFADKANESDNYQVAGAATGAKTGDATTELKIGTLVVDAAADGDTWVDVNVSKSKATYTDDATKDVATFEWNVITDAEDSKPDESSEDESKEESKPDESKEESKPDESKEEESKEESKEESSEESKEESKEESSKAEESSKGGDESKGGDDGSPDTGVASTAVVALAAASAALVVVSKKRK